jgi:hypothetical protein
MVFDVVVETQIVQTLGFRHFHFIFLILRKSKIQIRVIEKMIPFALIFLSILPSFFTWRTVGRDFSFWGTFPQKFAKFITSAGIVANFAIMDPVLAGVPTMDDYNLGSGSIVKTVKNKASNIKAEITIFPEYEATDISTLVPYYQSSLKTLQTYITQHQWEDVLQVCKIIDTSSLQKPIFGLNPNANTYLLDKKQTKTLENFKEELRFLLEQIRDIAISKRVYFFNRADLEQIELIKQESNNNNPQSSSTSSATIPTDIDQSTDDNEIQGLLQNAQDVIVKIDEFLKTT